MAGSRQGLIGLALAVILLPTACTKKESPTSPGLATLAVSTTTLPTGIQGQAYNSALAASGGDSSYGWAASAGALPDGLSLATNGTITGVPLVEGIGTFTAQVTSGDGQTASRQVSITIHGVLAISTASLPAGVENEVYATQSLTATGGDATYSWTLASGSGPLPAGLTLSADGDIAGTPTTTGTFSVMVEASSAGQTAQATLSITISPLANTRILFISLRDGNREVYVMDTDGANQTNLTNNSAQDLPPTWSPDGTKIAFATDRNFNAEIYVMDVDGSNPVNLTNHPAHEFDPAWSPDGSKIAFYTTRDGNDEIYVMDADGSNQVRLTNDAGSDREPDWSADGSKIAFQSNRDGDWEIFVMNADGSNQVNLTNNSVREYDPAWSPDGSLIAFTTERDGNWEIYTMATDGSNPVNVTNATGQDYGPAWSPDGSMIAFQAGRDSSNEIYVMDADGSNQTNLSNNPASEGGAAWAR